MMKKILTAACCAVSAALAVEALAESVKMPNGQIYKNPIVMGQTPLGLDIGYDGGIAFWKFTDLPESYQKKYGYDPAKAAEYEKQLQASKAAAVKREAAKEAENEKINLEVYTQQVKAYGLKIQDLETKLKQYREKLADFKAEEKDDDNKVMQLASSEITSNANSGNVVGWGYVCTGGGDNLQQVQAVNVSDKIQAQADDDRFQVRATQMCIYQIEHDLPVMKDTYACMQARLKRMQDEAAKKATENAAKPSKAADFQSIEKHLAELTELHRKKLISDEEYKAEKEELLKAM